VDMMAGKQGGHRRTGGQDGHECGSIVGQDKQYGVGIFTKRTVLINKKP
jgi:hypothetical protein